MSLTGLSIFRTAEVEYCLFKVSERFGAVGDFERERERDLRSECCNTIAVGLGPISFRYTSSTVGGLTMSPDTIVLVIDSSLQ